MLDNFSDWYHLNAGQLCVQTFCTCDSPHCAAALFLPSLKACTPIDRYCIQSTLHAGSPTPCSTYCYSAALGVRYFHTHILLLAPGQKCINHNELKDKPVFCWLWLLSHRLCLCLCVCSMATGSHHMVLWTMETVSTRVDPKTEVSEHKKVNKIRLRIYRYVLKQFLQVVTLVLTSVAVLFLCCSDGWGQQWVIDGDHR